MWAGSHFFGVGESVDVLPLIVGAFTIGWSIPDVARDVFTGEGSTSAFGEVRLSPHGTVNERGRTIVEPQERQRTDVSRRLSNPRECGHRGSSVRPRGQRAPE
jgi:hypothetical protein